MSNVKLAIRVRPFTERELKSDKEGVAVVNVVDNNTVTITNVKVSTSGAGDSRERVRTYYADYTFDSCCPPTHLGYASQDKVFESIGRDVVSCVLRGDSACVLAYGQSATGKTHTMVGSEAQPGLVPRLCQALLDEGSEKFAVTVSFLEIYNERVHDLLAGEETAACSSLPRRRGNARKDLRVREHPARGTYVQNLRRVAVHDSRALLTLVAEGARRRRSAATRRNPSSSRSHAILELATPDATLHLADLAGSEKASWEGCGGGRQKEGANINKSLVALSNVISALVSAGSGRGRFVPYRDSALTWLLKDCFTGGARTFIIATVSPSVTCYGESASTLRWAARSRQLPEARTPPHQPQATRSALQAQLTKLIAELATHHIRYIPESGRIVYDDNHWEIQANKRDKDKVVKMNPTSLKPDTQNSLSPASSIASGSSEVINAENKVNLTNIISAEMDKLFGPSLERTRSGSDLKVMAPYRVKRRQYRSQEVLPVDKTLYTIPPVDNLVSPKLCQEQQNADNKQTQNTDSNKPQGSMPVPILYDNQRAEIVASVTERLYSKLKKKEESAVAKMESVVDKKIMEPLSELRICTNARQRLMELSQKAMRNKRRIGIPAYSQTRKHVIRVKDQGVDVQNDLQPYFIKERDTYTPHQDIGTETVSITPRCKEIAVGPKCGSVTYSDTSTVTDEKRVQYRNSFVMTDDLVKCDSCTQTIMVPPPRKKKLNRILANLIRSENKRRNNTECSPTSVININISQTYSTDSESPSDEGLPSKSNDSKPVLPAMTPDLLTNHNAINAKDNDNSIDVALDKEMNHNPNERQLLTQSLNNLRDANEFPDEDCSLPRVRLQSISSSDAKEIKNMIMGHNENLYPYNIILSPPRERDNFKRTVKFKEIDETNPLVNSMSVASQTSWEWDANPKDNPTSEFSSSDKDIRSYKSDTVNASTTSDSTDSSKADSDAFVWKQGPNNHFYHRNLNSTGKSPYTHVSKSNIFQNRTSKAKMYREFLGLDQHEDTKNHVDNNLFDDNGPIDENSQKDFKQKRQFFEDKFEKDYYRSGYSYSQLERNILRSCDRMEESVNKYDDYLKSYRQRQISESARSPREYLQHLVEIRRQVVKEDSDNVESSNDSYQTVF